MKLKALFVVAVLCAIAVPAASLAGSATKQDRINGARACSALRSSLGAQRFGLTYGTTPTRSDANGKCVAAWTAAATTARQTASHSCQATKGLKGTKLAACVQSSTQATLNTQVAATENAAKTCAAERSSGVAAFTAKYGTNVNKSNAFGKCVSTIAKANNNGNGGGLTKTRYQVSLAALNSSGVTGHVSLTLAGNQLTVVLQARNLEAGKEHMQHIHGLVSGTATCPTVVQADTSPTDGVITFAEGLPFYGAVVQALTPYPTANASGNVSYTETLTVNPATLGALETRTIVLHGKTINGGYDASLPVACGQITKV